MAGGIPDIVIRLTGDVDAFIRAWNEAARAAEEAAARIRAAGAAAGNGPDADRFRDLNGELDRLIRNARAAADSVRELGNSSRRSGDDVDELGRRIRDLNGRLGSMGSSIRGIPLPVLIAGLLYLASMLPAVIAGILGLATAAGGLAIGIATMALGARGLGQAFDRLQATIAPLQRQLDSLFRRELGQEFAKLGQTITSELTPAFKGVGSAMADLIKDTTQWIRSSEGISTIKTAMGGVQDLIRELSPAVKGLVQIFAEWMAAAAPSMKVLGQAISEVVVSLRDMFREAQKSGQLDRIFKNAAEAIKGFGEIIKGIIMILLEMADKGGGPAADSMQKLGKALQDAAPAIGQAFKALAMLGDVLNTIIGVISTVVGWIAKMAEGMNDIDAQSKGIKDFFGSIPGMAKSAGDAIMGFFAMIKEKFAVIDLNDLGPWWDKINKNISKGTMDAKITVGQWITKTVSDIKEGADKAIAAVKQWWDKTVSDVKAGVDKVLAPVKQWWDKTVTEVKAGANKAAAAVKQWADKTVQDVKSFVDKTIQSVKEWWDKTVSEVKAGVDRVLQSIKEMGDKLLEEVKKLPEKFVQAGKDMVDGIVKGAKAQADALIKVFEDMAQKALAAVKRVLGIASPSQVFEAEVGHMIPAGIAQGITKGAPAMTTALNRAMRQLPINANVALAGGIRGAAIGAAGGRQVIEVKLAVGSGGDGAMGQAIAGLARRGQLKLTANAVVGGRR